MATTASLAAPNAPPTPLILCNHPDLIRVRILSHREHGMGRIVAARVVWYLLLVHGRCILAAFAVSAAGKYQRWRTWQD